MTSIGEMKTAAKAQLNGKWLLTTGVLVVGALILSALSFTFVGTLLLMGVIEFGYCAFLVTVTRNRDSEFGKLLSGFSYFGNVCAAGILKWLYTMLWSLLFFIPGIIKSYSYSMTMYIMQDNPGITGNEAIEKSRKMMDGHKFDLFLLDLSFIGWWLLGTLTFGILIVFYVEPYHQVTRTNFYEQLRMDYEGVTAPQEVADVTEITDENKQ